MDCFALEIADQVFEHCGGTIGNDIDLTGNRHQRVCLRIVIGPKTQVGRTDSPLWEVIKNYRVIIRQVHKGTHEEP